jgi:outer membrane lipase/esterase
MPRIRLIASSIALAICSVTAAQAQQFTSFAAFGDSLSDSGNIAVSGVLPFPGVPGSSFTTNPDPVSVQIIANAFGLSADPSLTGGSDFAWGGACVTTGPCETDPGPPTPNLGIQIGQYLEATGGHADPHGLFTYWGGANDVFGNLNAVAAAQGEGGGPNAPIVPESPQQAIINLNTDGHISAGQIGTLRAAGAGTVIVFNLPDISKTPQFQEIPVQVGGDQIRQLTNALVLNYNSGLNAGLAGMTGVVRVDTFGLFNEILASPSLYGFTDVTHEACGVGSTSVLCGPAGDPNYLFHYDPATVAGFAFADGVHPSGSAHAVIAQYVIAELSAPAFASMLAETPLQTFETQNRTIHDQMQADMGHDRPDGNLRSFAAFDYSRQRFDMTANSPETSVHDETLVIGADYHVNQNASFGIASTFTHQDASFAGGAGGFMNNEPMIAGWGLFHTNDFYVSLLGSVGQLNLNGIDRSFQLGAATRTESGSTSGSHVGYELAGGYFFHFGELKTGPYASIGHQRVRVSSYNENGSDSSTMFFGRQSRDSTISRIGWELSGDSKMWEGDFHPFARVAYEHESDANLRFVDAGVVGMNGTFSMPGFLPDSSYWTGELGVAATIGSNMSAFAAYNGHFGDSNQRVDSFNLGVKWSW